MKKTFVTLLSCLALGSSVLLTSCKKENSDDQTYLEENGDVQTENLANRLFDEVNDIADQAVEVDDIIIYGSQIASTPEYLNLDKSACATVTRTTTDTTINVVVDYGTNNCGCPDGKERRGKILIYQDKPFTTVGKLRRITFENFFVNDNQIKGTKTVVYGGLNATNQPFVTITITNGQVLLANNGGTLLYNATKKRTHVEGASTPLVFNDDVFQIEGSKAGTTPAGIAFTADITSPLTYKRNIACRQIVSGTVKFSKTGKPDKIIDFGDGTCDNQATVTVGSLAPRTIVLQ